MKTAGKAQGLVLPRRQTGAMLAAFGPLLGRGLRLYCLDAGNAFNPLPLATWLRARQQDVRPVFEHQVFVSRAFTCYQLAGAAQTLLDPLAQAAGPRVAVLLGLEEMFLDEDIRLKERRYLFERILRQTERLTAEGLPLLVTCGQGGKNIWMPQIARRVNILPDIHTILPHIRKITDGTHLAHL